MSSLHELLCPECGAQVPPTAPDVLVVVCHFCEHRYELEHARAAHVAREQRRVHEEKPEKRATGAKGGCAVVLSILALSAVGVWFAVRGVPSKPEHEHDIDWDSAGDPPRVVDVNGDGAEDFIGTYWKPEKGEARGDRKIELGAFDGATHVSLWIAGPFGRSNSGRGVSGVTHVAVAGGRVVLVDLASTAHVLELKTGKELAAVKLPDRVRAVCASPSGSEVWADVLGDRGTVIDVNRASASTAPRPPYCPESAPGSCLAHRGRSTCAAPRAAIAGARVDRLLSDATDTIGLGVVDGSTTVTSGRDAGVKVVRTPLPPTPTVVGLHRTTHAVLWQTPLGAGTPGVSALAAAPSVAELADGRVYAQYELKNGTWRLACVDAKSGSLVWDVKVLGAKHGDEARSIVASSSRVYLAHGDWLDLFDRSTGQQLGNFGK